MRTYIEFAVAVAIIGYVIIFDWRVPPRQLTFEERWVELRGDR